MATYRYKVIIEQDEDGLFVASCPALQGCYTEGQTYEEAQENIKDAIRLHIEARRELGEPVPVKCAIEEVMVVVEAPPYQAGVSGQRLGEGGVRSHSLER